RRAEAAGSNHLRSRRTEKGRRFVPVEADSCATDGGWCSRVDQYSVYCFVAGKGRGFLGCAGSVMHNMQDAESLSEAGAQFDGEVFAAFKVQLHSGEAAALDSCLDLGEGGIDEEADLLDGGWEG